MKKMILLLIVISMIILGASVYALEIGDRAPLFEAESSQGTTNLADYLGKKNVVLAFYFADFTPV